MGIHGANGGILASIPFCTLVVMIGNPVLVWELPVFHKIKFFLVAVNLQRDEYGDLLLFP